jgi:tetratricopeptide (TPR) repeat protein/TolB-like protein
MNRYFYILFFYLLFLFSPLCWAGGSKDKGEQSKTQQSVPVGNSTTTVYWNGDGGKGIKLAVLEPTGKGLSVNEQWILSMIQSSMTGDFQKYSAMTIVDRQNLEKILGEQRQSLSGNYSEQDYISIGKLTNARYILAGSITKTASTFMLEFAVTDAESGERKASYPPKAVSPLALENLSAIKEATTDLLRQLGVQLTNAGLQSLNSTSNVAQVKAETALAKGIEAQKQGTVVEALTYFIQANNYNTSLAEATSRMNILAANITSGNIGQDTRNDIAWRREWVKRLQETEAFFANSLKEPQPFYIIYSTDIKQGKVDYQKETTDLTIWMGFYPDFVWAQNINEVINTVKNGLQTTGRAQVWELDWPTKSINNPSPFVTQAKNSTSTVVVEIINNEEKSIGRQTVKSPYGFESRSAVITPLWQWEGDIVFTAVNANLITDKLRIQITSIDGIAAENAAKQKNISVMPLTEWESLLKMFPSTRQHIELAQNRLKADGLRKQADEQLKNGNTYLAITNYTEAIRLNPNDVMARNGLDNARQQEQREQTARQREQEAAAQRQREQEQRDPNYHYNQGVSYKDAKNYTQAIRSFTEAIRLNPNYASAYFWRGYAYGELKSYDQAIDDYSQAIRINPNYAGAYNNRGWAYEALGDNLKAAYNSGYREKYNKAKEDYDAALRNAPGNSFYINNANNIRKKL